MRSLEAKCNGNKKTMVGLLLVVSVLLVFYQLSIGSSPTVRLTRCPTEREHTHVARQNPRQRWIIAQRISSMEMVELSGWTLLIHGKQIDKNPKCIPPNCYYLDEELQTGGPNGYSQDLPSEMIAYSYAMSNGASHIFVVDYWHIGLNELLERFRYEEFASGIVAKTDKTIIDASTIFSEGKSSKPNASLTHFPHYAYYDYFIREDIHPLIQTCVPQHTNSFLLKGNRHQPQVFMPSDTFIPFDFEQTLFHENAFWALGLTKISFGSILAQKLLWEIEGTVGTSPKRDSGHLPVESLHLDHLIENPEFINIMKNSDCKKTLDFLECFSYLRGLLQEKNLMSEETGNVLETWQLVLMNIGYQQPRRSIKRQQKLNPKIQTFGIFSPSRTVPEANIALQYLQRVCPNSYLPNPVETINDIALIISFNTHSLYSNIPYLEAMYRRYFRHIIFCGPKVDIFRQFAYNTTIGDFIFIEAFKRGWHYMFDCTMEAMKMNLDVKGFVQIGDDTLLNPWSLKQLPKEKIWLHNGIKSANSSLDELKPNWIWWRNGKKNINKVFKEINLMRKYHSKSEFETRFMENFRNTSKNFTRYFIHGCDLMYVPMRVKEDFIKAGSMLIKHSVMLEIGFANIALGIENWENIHFVENGNLWANRHLNKEIYRKDMLFIHPFKIKKELKERNNKGRQFFCDYMKGENKTI